MPHRGNAAEHAPMPAASYNNPGRNCCATSFFFGGLLDSGSHVLLCGVGTSVGEMSHSGSIKNRLRPKIPIFHGNQLGKVCFLAASYLDNAQ